MKKLALALLLFAAPAFGQQFIGGMCINPSGTWIPISGIINGSAFATPQQYGILAQNNGSWYGLACDASGNITAGSLPQNASDPATCNVAQIEFNTTANVPKYCYPANTWNSWTGGGGAGVTSVALVGNGSGALFSATPGTAVTASGTLNLDAQLQPQSANCILAGPSSGSAADPTCRPMVVADLPATAVTGAGTTGYYGAWSGAHALGLGTIDHNVTTSSTDTDSQAFAAPQFNTTGTTPGAWSLIAGAGNIAALPANSAGLAAPATGGTSYLLKLPATIGVGILHAAAAATGDGVNESAVTSSAVNLANADVTGLLPVANVGTGIVTTSTPVVGSSDTLSCSATSNITTQFVAFATTISRPAFTQTAGAHYRLTILTQGTNSASPPNISFEMKDGSTAVYTTASQTSGVVSLTNAAGLATIDEIITTTGATANLLVTGTGTFGGSLSAGSLNNRTAPTASFASTSSGTLTLLMQCSANTAGNTMTLQSFTLERVY